MTGQRHFNRAALKDIRRREPQIQETKKPPAQVRAAFWFSITSGVVLFPDIFTAFTLGVSGVVHV